MVGIVMVFVCGCGNGCNTNLVTCPLTSGDEFVFEDIQSVSVINGNSYTHIPIQHIYRINPSDESEFKMDFVIRATDMNGKAFDNDISEKQGYHLFDRYGQLTGWTKGKVGPQIKGNFCKLWLQPSKRKNGAVIKFSMCGEGWKVSGPVRWGAWNTWMATCQAAYAKSANGPSAIYFDEKSGYMVGDRDQHLVGTNIKGLQTMDSKIADVIADLKKISVK
jgi:hypothetical protein